MKTQKIDCGCEKDVFACRAHAHPEHTPTPWTPEIINSFQGEQEKINADFMLRAVNSYEKDQKIKVELLEVLRIVALFDPNNPSALIQMCAVRDEAKKAIAKAEGK